MTYFIVRPFGNTQEVQAYDGSNFLKVNIDTFKQLEPEFSLAINIKQLDYYPLLSYEVINYNGTIDYPVLPWEEGDLYIAKVQDYLDALSLLNQPNLPATLSEAKEQVKSRIVSQAFTLINSLTSGYSTLEIFKWDTLLTEAEAYINTSVKEDAPNLLAIEIIRNPSLDSTSTEFADLLTIRAQEIIDRNAINLSSINHYIGIRGKKLDEVDAFEQSQMENESEAIIRLFAIDWETSSDWDIPD